MVAKVAGGILGIGLIGTGGIAVTKPWLLGMDYMPEWHSLSEDNGFNDSTYSDKFANKLTKYLVGVTHKKNGKNTETNEAWWEWSFRRLHRDKVDKGAFKLNEKVDAGFKTGEPTSGTIKKALSQVCAEAYKATSANVKADGNNDNEFNEEHVWKYCSPFGGKLKTVKDVDNKGTSDKYGGSKIGKTKEGELISATGPENDKFWEIRDQEFKKTGDGSLTSGDNNSYFFKNKQGKTIKELCEYVYGQTTRSDASNGGKIEENTVMKYCSLKGPAT